MVKLDKSDLGAIMEVYKIMADALSTVPKELYNSEKFGLIVVQASLNILCAITRSLGVKKEDLIQAFVSVWDARENSDIIN